MWTRWLVWRTCHVVVSVVLSSMSRGSTIGVLYCAARRMRYLRLCCMRANSRDHPAKRAFLFRSPNGSLRSPSPCHPLLSFQSLLAPVHPLALLAPPPPPILPLVASCSSASNPTSP